MKKGYYILASLFFGFNFTAQAQYIDEEEITVTNEEGVEEVITLPEGMTSDVDSLLYLYHTNTYLSPDNDCNLPDVNPVYQPEEYKARLAQLPTLMELPYNKVVQSLIDRYSGRLRRTIGIMLGAQNFYMPIFEQALETYNLPLELKYLPVIESSLNPNAVSRVGATGLWQFMLATGKQYGLEVNTLVDERRDPIKASYAAAHYLSDLYKIFGDWNLVIAAYNCGPENINKAIHRSGDKRDYWEIYPYLPKETRGYVPAFIAANYIMNYYCEHNICPMLTDLPAKTDTIMLNRDVHFEQISQVLGIDVKQLKELNPQYRQNIINGSSKPSVLKLPYNYVGSFIDNQESIFSYNAEQLLSRRTEVEVNEAQLAPSHSRSTAKRGNTRGRNRSSAGSVTVRKGDTLSSIAARNHTTVAKLRKINGIKGNNIQAGKKIRVR
ncbi:MAG: transglycosylase SLT domain-containing protein [Prevotella sp.]|nr:transglycosylase SLT domain-containing protein [Prevotella sp.]